MKTLGIVGLGKMGGSLGLQAVDKGIQVRGKALKSKPELESKGIHIYTDYDSFFDGWRPPRVIYLSLPAGKTIDKVLGELESYLDKGDVVMDGGNSFFMDSMQREEKMRNKGIHFLDCGTSGGTDGARNGACFMVGGPEAGIRLAEPLLKQLAVPDGYVHTGEPGSGHFVKLVHNGIEFGMLQAIGEGFELLQRSDFKLNLPDIFKNWSNGSVIRSWLIELMEKGLREESLWDVPDYIEDTGEVNWLVHYALEQEQPIPVISQSVMELFKSRLEKSETYKAIAIMRHGFGGHPFGKDEYIQKERKTSRLKKM